MSMTDPIADLLTRIRNGLLARHDSVDVPMSRIKREIVKILEEQGYVRAFEEIEAQPRSILRVQLKYDHEGERSIRGIERVSRPGRRVYCGKAEVPQVLDGLGVTIISTSSGLMTGTACKSRGLGGEVLCSVW